MELGGARGVLRFPYFKTLFEKPHQCTLRCYAALIRPKMASIICHWPSKESWDSRLILFTPRADRLPKSRHATLATACPRPRSSLRSIHAISCRRRTHSLRLRSRVACFYDLRFPLPPSEAILEQARKNAVGAAIVDRLLGCN